MARSTIRSARRLEPSEAQIKKAVCDWLDANRIRYHRLNSHTTIIPGDPAKGTKARAIRGAAAGTPDLLVLVCLDRRWKPVYIELKTKRGALTAEQRRFREGCLADGIEHYVCRSVQDAGFVFGLSATEKVRP